MAKQQIASIVGRDNLISDPELLTAYGSGNISYIPDRQPLFAVRPGNREEMKDVLKVAAMAHIPVTPSSSSKNGHGGAIPSVPGMTLDLRRLNTIHLIDENSRNAVIDAGVTFAQLQTAAKAKGLRVLTPLELPSDSSVVSSYLDMAPLYAWPRYGTESILTMEVMLSSGDLIKTGTAALPVFNEKPYMPFMGPPVYLNKVWYGAQGTYGIVTKATIKLKTDYENVEVLYIPFNAFHEALPAIKELKRLECGVEFFLANSAYLSSLLAEDLKSFDALKGDLPPVTAVMILRGEAQRVAYQKADIEDLGAKMGFAVHETLSGCEDASRRIIEEIEMPRGYEHAKTLKGAYHVIPFMCMGMQIPMFAMVLGQMTGAFKYDPCNIGQLLLPVEAGRFHFQYSFWSDPAHPQESMISKKLFEVLSGTLIKMGAFFSRPYGNWAAQVYAKAPAYKSLIREFKEVLDPAGILNPGKLTL